ncbi:transposable element Tc1 transposase [Trichonephila clavata]|uniref:Transposable element Tc1 transposase n=1 Tax=Trichonephila clavata TaxID=2740835 RepID=A0A8X6KG46_TRICU|nr:transposable element Tc1 transposase [Trichonephila clavata]
MPRSWVSFWAQFCRIHEDESIMEEDKFKYVLSSLKPKTKARDIVENYPPSKDNYPKVIEHLMSRFGRKDLLIEVYIRDFLALGVPTYLVWDRYILNREIKEEDPVLTKEKVLENLMSFLRHEVEGEEHRVLAETAFGSEIKRKDPHKQVQKDEPTAATLFANTSAGKICCVFCDRSHPSQDCQKLSSMNYENRKLQVMRQRCCLVCLKPGHMAKKCHSNVKSLICERRHYALLCPDLRKDTNSYSKVKVADEKQKSTEVLLTNLPSEREIYLKTITVRLRHKGTELCVRALMDDGSHRSYIEKSLAAELNLSPYGKEILSQGLFVVEFLLLLNMVDLLSLLKV